MVDRRIRLLHQALARRPPRLHDRVPGAAHASVGLIIRPAPTDLEILLIERPRSDTDPWSGHMALPGGRSGTDEPPLETAIREVLEEVGIDLLSYGLSIGRLDDVQPFLGGPQIAVSPFVFAIPAGAVVRPDPIEVATTVWIPLGHLASPTAAAEHLHPVPGEAHLRFPAFSYGRHIIWGLTYRMLIQFLGIVRSVHRGEEF